MKTGNKTLLSTIILLLIVIMLTSCSTPDIYKKYQLKVGQTWIYVIDKDDPFKSTRTHKQQIIAISGDYVQYVDNGDTTSCSKYWFVAGDVTLQKKSTKKIN